MIWGFNTWGRHGVGLDPQQGQLQVQAGEGGRRWDSSGHPDIPQTWYHIICMFSFWGFIIWVDVDKNKDQQHTSYLSFLAHTPILIAHNCAESWFFTKVFVNCQIWKVLLMHCVRYTAVSRTVKYVTNWSMWQKYGTRLKLALLLTPTPQLVHNAQSSKQPIEIESISVYILCNIVHTTRFRLKFGGQITNIFNVHF